MQSKHITLSAPALEPIPRNADPPDLTDWGMATADISSSSPVQSKDISNGAAFENSNDAIFPSFRDID